MTDQRPIDPSALRDGDIVRAKRGEHGVVEGVFHSYPISSGWGIGSEAEEDGLFAWNDKGWTITDILATPEPAPIEVGDWWADEEGLPHVVEVLHDGSVGLRRWTYSVVNRFVEPSLLRDYWTRLDGPPEPPEGSIIRMGQKGNRAPFAAMRCNDVWRATGWVGPLSWPALTSIPHVALATLQIVHTLGVK